jgi:hypothetical protein
MGNDRKGSYQINGFSLYVDKDHLGYYRGKQAISRDYRGWHYHIESEIYSQEEIMAYLEYYLHKVLNAKQIHCEVQDLNIGIIEFKPDEYSVWELDGKTCCLWISGFNHKLHIESNKSQLYTKNLLSKKDLIEVLKNWQSSEILENLCFGKTKLIY